MQTNAINFITSSYQQLTASERTIRYYNDQGLTSSEIASMLNLSPFTVNYYQYNLRRKLSGQIDQCAA